MRRIANPNLPGSIPGGDSIKLDVEKINKIEANQKGLKWFYTGIPCQKWSR